MANANDAAEELDAEVLEGAEDGIGIPGSHEERDSVPIPPSDANEHTTACDYCIVGCGYKVYTWPVGAENGGPIAEENALGKDFPIEPLGGWVSPNMYNRTFVDGDLHHVVVLPDPDTEVVNKGGDHSPRGGTLARKLYNPETRTAERLKNPKLRVNGELQEISWDAATRIVAEVGRYVIDELGETHWGMKTYSYGYYENTYAITKLAFDAVNTPMWAPHDHASANTTTPGIDDVGLYDFAASYEDWGAADVIFAEGAEIYEAKSILFNEWILPNDVDLICVDPREGPTATYARNQDGGMHLQVNPGTDSILNNAIARYIVEQGWEDTEWIEGETVDAGDLADEGWRKAEFGQTFEEYRDFLLSDDLYTVERAAEETGVDAERIREVARKVAQPNDDGTRPKSSFMLEKGNYWSLNYPNTASLGSLGLLCGAGGRPGRMISRAGGHQRGMMKGGDEPVEKSPHDYEGNEIMPDLEKVFVEGDLQFMWAVGVTWTSAMSASQFVADKVHERTREVPNDQKVDTFDVEEVVETLKRRVDAGNLVLVQQDIYPNVLTEKADLLLPASGWGEQPLTRKQGERRMRMYQKFCDPPGNARADWKIVAEIAQKMGYDGFDWADANEVFEEAAFEASAGGHSDYTALVELAREEGKTGHEKLAEFGTTGIQTPIRREGDELVGTTRIHGLEEDHLAPEGERGFDTASGKAIFPRGDFRQEQAFYEDIAPTDDDEFWLIDGRFNQLWQSMYDDLRKEFNARRVPEHFVLINPRDADRLGIEEADWVSLEQEVETQIEGQTYEAAITGLAYVTDEVGEGVIYDYFLYPGSPSNSFSSGQTDDVSNINRFKLKSAHVAGQGASGLEDVITFTKRNVQ